MLVNAGPFYWRRFVFVVAHVKSDPSWDSCIASVVQLFSGLAFWHHVEPTVVDMYLVGLMSYRACEPHECWAELYSRRVAEYCYPYGGRLHLAGYVCFVRVQEMRS